MVMGAWRWFVVGCYLAPDDVTSIEIVTRSTAQIPREAALLLVGYLNTNLVEMEGNKIYEAIAEDLSEAGLKVMSYHLLPLHTS